MNARVRAVLTHPRLRRTAYVAAAAVVAVLFFKAPALFWLVVVLGLVVALMVVLDQRDEAAAETTDLLFELSGVEKANRDLRLRNKVLIAQSNAHRRNAERLAADFDAVTARLAEVLSVHADCPAPVVTK